MSQAGQCRLSFVTLGKEGQFMCTKHWALVPDELKERLKADYTATVAVFETWTLTQREAVSSVLKATGSID